jgi:hypothetical protein
MMIDFVTGMKMDGYMLHTRLWDLQSELGRGIVVHFLRVTFFSMCQVSSVLLGINDNLLPSTFR